jgi:tRNA 5-methylaminomethyl-2-thiouridine biosynthesis bifunctional protein
MSEQMQPIELAKVSFDADTPVSDRFQDSYFMRGRGPEESQAVFIDASQLTQRFSSLTDRDLFVIGETGFGTGLNCLLAARCFLDQAPAGARLHLISAELHPLAIADLRRALSHWPQLSKLGARLLEQWPPPTPGYHRLRLAESVDLTLMLGDACLMWRDSRAKVDAWFLDGFAPARNPDMWQPRLFKALARRSRPGATLATFSAAGAVRRSLSQAGFEVRRESGFADKRHRLTGRWPGLYQAQRLVIGTAVVAGAGLAGATTARALAERGWTVKVMDPAGISRGASGNLAGVVYSTPSAHLNAQNRFYQSALCQALRWFDRLGFPAGAEDGRLNNLIQYPADARAADKLVSAMTSGAWPGALLESSSDGGYLLKGAGFIRPQRWCRHLLDHPAIEVRQQALKQFTRGPEVKIEYSNGNHETADRLVVATAGAARQLPGLEWLNFKLIRGQVSYCAATAESESWQQAICHAGYLTPALDGLHCVGATFDLKNNQPVTDEADDEANLSQLRTYLPEHWAALGGTNIQVIGQRAAVRCQSTDFLPLAGPLPDPSQQPHALVSNIDLTLAHGSRGITHTPLCADLIADSATGLPLPADPGMVRALAPERFIIRKRRRQPDWQPE